MPDLDSRIAASDESSAAPQVSIIMPVHNTPLEYVKRAFESVTDQTYKNLELIVVIDGCTKEYCTGIRALGEYDDRILIYRIEHVGVSGARNYAVEHGHGEYVMFMDSDDEMPNYAVEHALKALKENELDIAFGVVEFRASKAVWANHPSFRKGQSICILEGKGIEDARDHFFAREVPKSTPQLAGFHRGPVAQIMPLGLARSVAFDPDITYMEDAIFNAFLVAKANRIGLVDDIWYIYHQNAFSASNTLCLDEAFLEHAEALSKYYGIDERVDNDVRIQICRYFFDALANESRRKYRGRLKRIRFYLKQPVCMDALTGVDVNEFDISRKRRINYWLCKKRCALPIYLFYSLRAIGQRARGELPQSQ